MEDSSDLEPEEVSRVLKRANIISKRFRRRAHGKGVRTNSLVHYVVDISRVVEIANMFGILQTP